MKILINQNQYNLITEKVGVPNNIYNTATDIVYMFLNQFSKINDINNQQTFNISGNFKINDIVLNNIKINVEIIENDDINIVSLYNMPNNNNSIIIGLILNAPEPFNIQQIYEHLLNNKNTIITNFTHEIKHGYDRIIEPKISVNNRAHYYTQTELINKTNIKPIQRFLYTQYYINKIENSVRPSEMLADIKNKEIKQNEFAGYFNQTTIYITLSKIKNSTFENFINDLLNDKINMQKYLAKKRIMYTNLNDTELLYTFLESYYNDIKTSIENYIQQFNDKSSESNIDNLEYNIKQIYKYKDNPVLYFKNSIQQSSIKANMQIRKLAKLYSLL
jgi:hypothetical protein